MAMDEATKYRDRYRAVIRESNHSRLDISELQAWVDSEDLRINFRFLFSEYGNDLPEDISRFYVPLTMVGSAAGRFAATTHKSSAHLLRGVAGDDNIMWEEDTTAAYFGVSAKLERLILSAVYDRKVRLYDYLGMPIDVELQRIAYQEKPEAFASIGSVSYFDTLRPSPLPEKAGDERPVQSRERSNMLRVIRALCVIGSLPPRGAAIPIEKQLQVLGFDGPKESTIRSIVDAARDMESDSKT